jgi:hypothetical protein
LVCPYVSSSRTRSLSLRRFVALPKLVQADYQPCRLQDKTAQLQLYTELLLHGRNRSRIHLLEWYYDTTWIDTTISIYESVVLRYHLYWYYDIN